MLSLKSASTVIDMQMCTFAFEREKWLKNTDKNVFVWPVKITDMFHAHCFCVCVCVCVSFYHVIAMSSAFRLSNGYHQNIHFWTVALKILFSVYTHHKIIHNGGN